MNGSNRSLSWLLFGALLFAACDDAPFPCTPGRQISCDCPRGRQGIQVCAKDGTYDECSCGASTDESTTPAPRRDASVSNTSTPDWFDTLRDAGFFPPQTRDASADATVVLGTCTSKALPYRPLDVEYSSALDRIIAVAASPNRLLIHDPHSDAVTEVMLPLSAGSVSVSSDGKTAAVSHNAYLSLVDLSQGMLTTTFSVSSDAGDIVLANNGYAYVFAASDQQRNIHSVELATKTDHVGNQYALYGKTHGRLHPGGSAIYAVRADGSSSNLNVVDISAGQAKDTLKSSPYQSDHPICDEVWFTESGDRLLTACGTAFRAVPGTDDDMTYAGALGGANGRFKSIVHSATRARVYGIPTATTYYYPFGSATPAAEERQVRVYTADFLALETSLDVPCLQTSTTKQAVYGRYVFASPKGDQLYVLGQLDPAVGAAQDWTLAVLPL